MNLSSAEPRRPPEPASEPDVVAIVVSYNSARDLPACLASLEAQRGVFLEIHVVDNASHDRSAELVRREFPRVHLTVNDHNVGFARANNQVLEHRSGPFYALVNPDTVVHPDAIATCLEFLRRTPAAGVAATRLMNPDGTLQPSTRSFLNLANLFGETFGLDRLFGWIRPLASYQMRWFRHDRMADVDWITGAFLVVRGEVVRKVGGFDPEFFMYGEEMDWCLRIRRAGWRVVFLPDPPVVHAVGASSDPIAGPMFVENLKGRVRFLKKYRGPFVAAVARTLIAVSVILRLVWAESRRLGGARSESVQRNRARFRAAMRWVLAGMPRRA